MAVWASAQGCQTLDSLGNLAPTRLNNLQASKKYSAKLNNSISTLISSFDLLPACKDYFPFRIVFSTIHSAILIRINPK